MADRTGLCIGGVGAGIIGANFARRFAATRSRY